MIEIITLVAAVKIIEIFTGWDGFICVNSRVSHDSQVIRRKTSFLSKKSKNPTRKSLKYKGK